MNMIYNIRRNQTGSIMITVLVMLVFISLGAGMVMMFSTSNFQMVEHNIALKATTLAEAGLRYALGEYRDAPDQFNRLESLNQEEVTLLNNKGSFKIAIHPYWFVPDPDHVHSVDDPKLFLKVLGKFPDGFQEALPDTGQIIINNSFYDFSSITPNLGTGFDSDKISLSITITPTLKEDIDTGTSVELVFSPSSPQTISDGGDITLFSTSDLLDIFPERNGVFQVSDYTENPENPGTYRRTEDIGTYRYKKRTEGSVIFSGIVLVTGEQLPLTITSSRRIVLSKQIFIESTGSLGTGTITSNRGLGSNIPLAVPGDGGELEIAADITETLGLGGAEQHEGFDDEVGGLTQLENWESNESDDIPEADKKTITTVAVETEFDDFEGWESSTNYVTFQNFTEVDQDNGYTAELIDKERLPEEPEDVRNKNLNGLWGNASDNIYFVGDDGTIIHYNGTDFTSMESGTNKDLNAIWGLPSEKTDPDETDNIFVVGDDGETLINEEGDGWIHSNHDETHNIYAANGTSWGHFDGYGAAGTNPFNWDSDASELDNYSWYINEYDGHANFRCLWATEHTYPFDADYGATGEQTNQNIMVGEFSGGGNDGDGIIMHEFYEPGVIIAGTPLRGVWGSSFSNIYAVGDSGAIYHNTGGDAPDYGGGYWERQKYWNGKKWKWRNIWIPPVEWDDSWQGKWIKIDSGDVPTTENLNGIYGNNENDFYVIGDNGTIIYNKGEGFQLPNNKVTTENLNSIWGSDSTGIYAVGDNGTIVFLGYPSNQIGGHILPLSKNSELAQKWADTQNYLSYSIQVKTVWGNELAYGAAGICFRWHQSDVSGKYEGYGISFIRYDSSGNAYNDMIPDSIKPGFRGVNEKDDQLLLVLWEQFVEDETEQKRWIAYKDITDDGNVKKTSNGTPRDLSSLFVRVHEKRVEGVKVNDINIYYGNASEDSEDDQSADQKYNNTIRNEYNPTFETGPNTIKWPVFDIDKVTMTWTQCSSLIDTDLIVACEAAGEEADSFTLVDNVSVAEDPVKADGTTKYWIVNPAADFVILKNSFTIRARRFTSPDGSDFGTQSERSEIGLHVFGDIGDSGTQSLVSFTDFAVQLGVDADAVNAESSFGSLQ